MKTSAKKLGDILLNITAVIGFLLVVWFVTSWINVITYNLHPGGVELMADWNLFKIFFA